MDTTQSYLGKFRTGPKTVHGAKKPGYFNLQQTKDQEEDQRQLGEKPSKMN